MALVSLHDVLTAVKDFSEKLEVLVKETTERLPPPGTVDDPETPCIQGRVVTPLTLREASVLGCLGREAQRKVDTNRIQASALAAAVLEQSAPVKKLREGVMYATNSKPRLQIAELKCMRAKEITRLFFEGLLCLSGATSCLHLPRWGAWLCHFLLGLAGAVLMLLPVIASKTWEETGCLAIPGFTAVSLLIIGLPFWSRSGSHRLAWSFQTVNLSLRDAGASKYWAFSWEDGVLCGLAVFAVAVHSYAAYLLLDLAFCSPLLTAVSLLVLLGHAILLGRLCKGLAFLVDAFSALIFEQEDVKVCWERWALLCSLTRSTDAKIQGHLLALQVSFLGLLWQSCLLGARWSKSRLDILNLSGNVSILLLIAFVFLRAARIASFHSQVKQHMLTAEMKGSDSWQLHWIQTSVLHADVSLSFLNERLTYTFLAREAYVLTGVLCFLYANSYFS